MTEDFIELLKDFLNFNRYRKNKLTLAKYLVQELNYNEEEANEINRIYNLKMNYS